MARLVSGLVGRVGSFSPEGLVPLPALAMEALWLYPWMVWFSSRDVVTWVHPPLGLGSTLAVLAVAYLSGRRVPLSGSVAGRWALLIGNVLLVVLLLRLEQGGGHGIWSAGWFGHAEDNVQKLVSGLLYGSFLIWRGVTLGRDEITFDGLYRRFVFGFLALALLLIIWSGSGGGAFEPLGNTVVLFVAGFFFAGLTALALNNMRSVNLESGRLTAGGQRLGGRWVTLAMVLALGMVLAGTAVASVATLDFTTYVIDPLSTVADWLLIVALYAVIFPLVYIAVAIAFVVRWVLGLMKGDEERPQFDPPAAGDIRELADDESKFNIPPELVTAGKWGLLALGITIVLFILVRLFIRRRTGGRRAVVEEISEYLWSWSRLWMDFLSVIGGFFNFLRGRLPSRERVEMPVAARQGLDESRQLSVREIYQGLLWEGRESGRPKRPSETPWEYGARLDAAMAGRVDEVRQITDAYVRTRYGHEAVEDDRERLLNRLWRTLRRTLRGEE